MLSLIFTYYNIFFAKSKDFIAFQERKVKIYLKYSFLFEIFHKPGKLQEWLFFETLPRHS